MPSPSKKSPSSKKSGQTERVRLPKHRITTPQDMTEELDFLEGKVFLLKFPDMHSEHIKKGKTVLIKCLGKMPYLKEKHKPIDYFIGCKALYIVEDDKLYDFENISSREKVKYWTLNGIMNIAFNNLKTDDVDIDLTTDLQKIYKATLYKRDIPYNLTFMPIESYLTQHGMKPNEKKGLLKAINELVDSKGQNVSIPIDVWNYIMEFVFDQGLNSRRRVTGGKRTRRRVKKTRK